MRETILTCDRCKGVVQGLHTLFRHGVSAKHPCDYVAIGDLCVQCDEDFHAFMDGAAVAKDTTVIACGPITYHYARPDPFPIKIPTLREGVVQRVSDQFRGLTLTPDEADAIVYQVSKVAHGWKGPGAA